MHSTTLLRFLATVGAISCAAGSALAADGYLSQPALCGDRLLFVSEGDLWIATLDPSAADRVTAHRLTNGPGMESDPVISPDGTRVAFAGEYEGNRDVYVMPLAGGVPQRLTFHPGSDVPLVWSRDGKRIAFHSERYNPLGRQEAFWVDATGGLAEPFGIGECSQVSISPTGSGFVFCRWSNEHWTWKRYRGGTAPEIWSGDLTAKVFTNLTNNNASDLFPMWIGERVHFVSDRDGAMNIWSMRPDGGDAKQHTHFVNDASKPTDPATYELRWASPDASGGSRIVFAQAGGLCIWNGAGDRVQRLAIELVSDRSGTRERFVSSMGNATDFSLSPSGNRLLLETRGELVVLPVGKPKSGTPVGPRQVTHESGSREWGAVWISPEELVCVTDSGGEQQLATVAADGSSTPKLITTDRSQWIMRPVASPDGRFVAFGDKDMRLWLLDVAKRAITELDRGDAGEIIEYSFSRDGAWLAWSKPMANGNGWITLRSTADGTTIDLSDGLTNDRQPQFDPRGKYLWFLSDRSLNPIIGTLDFEHALVGMTEILCVPLEASTPPPSMTLAAAAGFDLKKWAQPIEDGAEDAGDDEDEEEHAEKPDAEPASKEAKKTADKSEADGESDDDEADAPTKIDGTGIRERMWRVPVDAGNHRSLVAAAGGVWFLTEPVRGIADAQWPTPPLGEEIATLSRFSVLEGEAKEVIDGISAFAASRDGKHVAWFKGGKFAVRTDGGEKDEAVDPAAVQIAVNPPAEWAQMLDETWRLQRDFYWAPNMVGVDWPAMRERYRALLPKVGTRTEMSDVLGQLVSELGTSHTYIMGGDEPDRPKPIGVGLLGVEFGRSGNAVTIASVLPSRPGDEELISPLALPHLEVKPGSVVLSIDGRPAMPSVDPYSLLLDRAGRAVAVEIADDIQGNNRRTIEVIAREEEHSLRYAQWVDGNRRTVEELSGGQLGYVHVPDMDADGLIEFSRTFYAQIRKKGMVVDIRNNGGGWVSQLILSRVARKPWAYQVPRQGRIESYPQKVLDGPFVVLIDQHAGSDGDIFPESVRINHIAPLIGMRTWGGVVGIRGDKPAIDLCTTTQPEFAWFDPSKAGVAGWSVENVGVAPDIEVDTTPADRMAGRDPQLAKGVEVLLETLQRSPRAQPTPPPYPDRSKIAK
ncbi:MAG: PD40 domain-containing protein [Phycisphaerae bacterium]|jgi:tricorn protease|nr:PD40 domain-containing protein [Phycisphaerae bacterium]